MIRRIFFALGLAVILMSQPRAEVNAAIPIAMIIKEAVKKVIKAVDLMVQRLQNKTIWLQNAQKVLENKLNELKLTEIAEWTEKHRKLYEKYYDELWNIKNTIAMYRRVKHVMERQVRLVDEYKRTWDIIQRDDHFTKSELEYMYQVYTGILNESVKNLDQILLVINSYKVQISDAKRLEIIARAGDEIERNYKDLKLFNNQNIQLSLNR